MSNLLAMRPEIHLLKDFRSLQPDDPRLLGIGLLCIDLENIFIPIGGDEVQQRDVDHVQKHRDAGKILVAVTNTTEHDRAQVISDQLGFHGVLAKGQRKDPSDLASIMRSKTSPDLFKQAVDAYGFGRSGRLAAMVDDQLKNVRGTSKVPDFTKFFWTFPNYFWHQHPGSLAFRPLEAPIGFGLIGIQKVIGSVNAIRSIANGTHGEW